MRRLQIDPGALRGVVLPAGASDVLLPNAAVAEVLAYQPPHRLPDTPPWLLGMLRWREREVPVVSLSAASDPPEPAVPGRRARLAVCFSPDGNPELPYLGLLCVGSPRLARFAAETLEPAAERPANPFVLHALTFAERPAWIPDLDALERAILDALAS